MLQNLWNRARSSLTLKIFLTTASILFAACLITYAFLAWATPISFDTITETIVISQTEEILENLRSVSFEDAQDVVNELAHRTGLQIMISDLNHNTIIYSNDSLEHTPNAVPNDALSVAFSSTDTVFSFVDSDAKYQLILASAILPTNYTVQAMQQVLPALIPIILLISLLGALFYSRYITRPIVRLSAISEQMTALDFTAQSLETRNDEIGVLGRNLDELSQRLSGALSELHEANAQLQKDILLQKELARQRAEFFAAVSHELKTPITILSGQLTGMIENVGVYQDHKTYLPRTLSVVKRMEKLVGELLIISRMEQDSTALHTQTFNLAHVVQQQIHAVSELAELRQQTISSTLDADSTIVGRKDFIAQAISNLLSNAVMHSPEHAQVQVLLDDKRLIVRNSGVQIPQTDLPHLFEPLYRVDASRNRQTGGSGLGLYFVKTVLDRHHASYAIHNTVDGVETMVQFSNN